MSSKLLNLVYYMHEQSTNAYAVLTSGWSQRADSHAVLFKLDACYYTPSNIFNIKWNLVISGCICGRYASIEITTPITPSRISIVATGFQGNHTLVQVVIPTGVEQRILDASVPAISVYNPNPKA